MELGTATSRLEYEVFLSFRGPDTRSSFSDHLYSRLIDAGIRVYRDDEELRVGQNIGPELLKGINQSKIAIPIFSKGYAESKWCLKELAQMVDCMKTTGLKVIPIFYDVTPHEVRNQTRYYEKAFELHEMCYDQDTINSWKKALREVGELKGWDLQDGTRRRQEGEVVKEVTNVILRELKKAHLVVTNYLIGLEHHIENVLSMLAGENGVKIVAIHGIGGTGKTTLGKVIYNYLLHHFESHCFLADIRETAQSKGIKSLQKRLISDILRTKSIDFSNIDEGVGIIKERFCDKMVLLFLDDVDEISQLKALIGKGNHFGFGSKIIITTRNKGTLDHPEVDQFYECSGLDSHHALQLFSLHAFRNDIPPKDHAALSQRIVEMAGGLPLALEIYGSLLRCKSKEEWASIVKRMEKFPHKEIYAKLKISFDALDDQQKQIFLDIACFFIGEDKRIAIHFWDESESPEEAIEVLLQMSLIKIKGDHSLWMHDHLRDIGREIVRQEHKEPERRTRLWDEEATKLLMRQRGSDEVRGMNVNFQGKTYCSILNEEFARLPNLRLLGVYELEYKWYEGIKPYNFFRQRQLIFSKLRWLSWHYFPPTYDTSLFSFEDMVILDLSYSKIESNWSGWSCVKMAKNLKVLNLTGCDRLVGTPNFSSHPLLERLILRGCWRLVEIHESISKLEHLVILDLEGCISLCKLPEVLSCTNSLEELYIKKTHVEEFPSWPCMRKLRVLSYSPIDESDRQILKGRIKLWMEEIEYHIRKFFGTYPDLTSWRAIKLPESIGDYVSLTEIDLSGSKIFELPNTIGNLKNLKVLSVRNTYIRELPTTIALLENLISLDASGCQDLRDIPRLPQSLISLQLMSSETLELPDLSNLINLKNLGLEKKIFERWPVKYFSERCAPWWIGRLTNLERLKLNQRRLISLHADLGTLSQLTKLELLDCHSLESIPGLPSSLKILFIRCCNSLTSLIIGNCTLLEELSIVDCENLSEIHGLEMLENLTALRIIRIRLESLPDLSNLKKLKNSTIDLSGYTRLHIEWALRELIGEELASFVLSRVEWQQLVNL